MIERRPRRGHQRDNVDPVWTPFRVRQLANLRERGYGARYIADALGLTINSVRQAAHYYCLPKLKAGRPRHERGE